MKRFITHCAWGAVAMMACAAPQVQAQPNQAPTRTHATEAKPLNRGLLAVAASGGVFVSWRQRATDTRQTSYNLYRDGVLVKGSPFTTKTNVLDTSGKTTSVYSLEVCVGDEVVERQDNVTPWDSFHKLLNLGTGPVDKRGLGCTYTPNDCSVYDMDGDGEYEIIVKWDPSNSKDSASSGVTGSTYLSCHKLDGTMLWMIDLGQNIRSGAHYVPFLCYDFDGDGFGELVCKTAPGTLDGQGNYITSDDPKKSYLTSTGRIQSGPEYLTIFDGTTGAALATTAYKPAYGDVSTSVWGDSYGNRSDRYLACVAFLDGEHPSAVMCRGYYCGAFIAAYDFDGTNLNLKWYMKNDQKGKGLWGEGAHSLAVGDVDADGCDEIVYGSACINNDGTVLYRTGFGHGDALHLGDFNLDNPGLEVYMAHEESGSPWDSELRDARTGKVLAGNKQTGGDTGRGLIGDFDNKHDGAEFYDSSNGNMIDAYGNAVCPWHVGTTNSSSINFRVYWTGDLYDEYHDRQHIDKWDSENQSYGRIIALYDAKYGGASSINYTKYNPNLQADFLGDWREEIVYWTQVDQDFCLNIFTTTYESDFALPTLRDDHIYDMAIVWQNVGYNQPPHLGYSPVDRFTVKKQGTDDCMWVPFYAEYKVDMPRNVEAYTVSSYSKNMDVDTVALRNISATVIPAKSPVLIKLPSADLARFIPSTSSETPTLSVNFLRGISDAAVVTSDPETTEKGEFFYEFRHDPELGYGFFLIDSKELPANTAYLRVKETSTFKHAPYYLLGRPFNEALPTGIEEVMSDAPAQSNVLYDLMGRRVLGDAHGVYIQDGKKVMR